MSDVLRVLREARELITLGRRWTVGYAARDRSGSATSPTNISASCWCGIGAIFKVAEKYSPPRLANQATSALHSSARREFDKQNAGEVNDKLGHAAVLRMFDAAIAAEQAKLASPSP